ncbi:hypothetical protein J1C56_02425 [Aminobacter anthyllidis]|uniref:RNA ligase domain-containing protein n=1 Tax=Aminobacter anthyllidis TaxID=1035067 RepID=A0A9X1D138_9HYPH|nr:RNA ligase family protein [Aminobacter anthyllidis]MBT1154440.1 hypothetical protein [Aminobacter anthyllidis]
MQFQPFPKLSRLSTSCIITEKLDGTNAQIVISEATSEDMDMTNETIAVVNGLALRAGSRSRWITPGKATDNYGFAAWAERNAPELAKLGLGQHFGEWYGHGIQRGYGLGERHFALFNSERWGPHNPQTPNCVQVVPVLHKGAFSDADIEEAMCDLRMNGSRMVDGFMNPEGIVVYVHSARSLFKKTFEYDLGKWQEAA